MFYTNVLTKYFKRINLKHHIISLPTFINNMLFWRKTSVLVQNGRGKVNRLRPNHFSIQVLYASLYLGLYIPTHWRIEGGGKGALPPPLKIG